MIKPPVLLAHLAQQSRHVLVMPLPARRQLIVMLDEPGWARSKIIQSNSIFHSSTPTVVSRCIKSRLRVIGSYFQASKLFCFSYSYVQNL